jgi:hypothetical protein
LFLTKRYFSQSNYYYNNSQFKLQYAFHKNFYLELNRGVQRVIIRKKLLYLLEDNGSVVEDDIYNYDPNARNSITRGGQLRWFFTPTSQLFFNYQRLKSITTRPEARAKNIVDEEDLYRLNRLELGLVWNLNRR